MSVSPFRPLDQSIEKLCHKVNEKAKVKYFRTGFICYYRCLRCFLFFLPLVTRGSYLSALEIWSL